MPTRLLKWACVITLFLISLIGLFVLLWLVRSSWLTWIHEAELRPVAQKYLEVIDTIEGNRDPNVMAQVATGKYLEYLIRVRCVDCPGVKVATGIQIQTFKVSDYGTTTSKVRVQYEGGWQLVDPQTRAVIGQCNVGVYDIDLIMVREDSVWKIADGDEFIPKVISKDEFARLQSKYCSR